jgi:hypothetical protein
MFEVVKKMDLSACCLSSDHLRHLWHKSGLVDLALVIDLHLDLDAILFLFAHHLCLTEWRISSMII